MSDVVKECPHQSKNQKITEMHIDVLKEIGNIGLGNAATSLAQMLNKKVDMQVPKAAFISMEEAMAMIGGLEEVVACVTLRVEGDVPAQVLFVFNEESAWYLVDMLMGLEQGTTGQMDEMGQSVIQEVGNMLTSSFLVAIGTMTNLQMTPNVPMFAYDMLGAVLSTSLIEGGYVEEHILLIETVLFEDQKHIKGHFFFITQNQSLDVLFSALGITMN